MQNRQIGKGADKKSYCALFLRGKTEGSPFIKEAVETEQRRNLAGVLKTYRPYLLCTGYCGLQKAQELCIERHEEIRGQFPGWLPGQIEELSGRYTEREGQAATEAVGRILSPLAGELRITKGLDAMYFPLSEGGIFRGLWDLGETLFCGIEAELLQIPMKQSIIEISNLYQFNPYKESSPGAGILVCNNAPLALRALQGEGIAAAVIGQITDRADRIMIMPEGVSYLTGRE